MALQTFFENVYLWIRPMYPRVLTKSIFWGETSVLLATQYQSDQILLSPSRVMTGMIRAPSN